MGSKSDMETMQKAAQELEDRGIRNEVRVMSAHRDPDVVADYAKNARMRGLRVIIAGAGLAAALPGVVAAHTDLPVIGVPLTSKTSVPCSRRCRPCRGRTGTTCAGLRHPGPSCHAGDSVSRSGHAS